MDKYLKANMRKVLMNKRNSMEQALRIKETDELNRYLIRHLLDKWKHSRILGFWPMRGEIDIRPTLNALLENSCKVYLPKIMSKTEISPIEYQGEAQLESGAFGTKQPTGSSTDISMDLIIVPGLGVDKEGNRLGYGGGYYDRYITKCRARTLMPAMSVSLVSKITCEEHDMPLDEIIYYSEGHVVHYKVNNV